MEEDEGVKVEKDQIVIDRPTETKKPPSARQIKRMELDAEFLKMEAVAGRKLKQCKNGKIDKRTFKERSPAQIAAAKRLIEYNAELRRKKKAETSKESVKEVIKELAVVQEMRAKDKKEEQEQEKKKEKEQIQKKNEDKINSKFSLFVE
ncbi:MAG: hypothetical protein CL512_06120 [Actinobacteria bacterium]|nr:hypothetical protein [Actinomycetota bacterium]